MRQNEMKVTAIGSGYSSMMLPDSLLDLVQETYSDDDGGHSFSVAIETTAQNEFLDALAQETGFLFNTVSHNHNTRHLTVQQSTQRYAQPTPTDQANAENTQAANANAQNHRGQTITFRDVSRDGNADCFFASPIFRGVNENRRLEEDATRRRIYRLANAQAEMNVDEVEATISEITSLMEQLTQKKRKLNRLEADINDNPLVAELYQQAETLRNTQGNKIEDVFFTENHLVIRTENLRAFCESDGQHREIGSMEFLISLEALIRESFETRFIVIRNRTREMVVNGGNARQAPHVGAQGNACFGNITNTIIELMARRDLITIVDQLIRYIETPNEGDTLGKYAKYWPLSNINQVGDARVETTGDQPAVNEGGAQDAR